MLINVKMFYKLILLFFNEVGQTCSMYPVKFVISLWDPKKEVRNEVMDLSALAYDSNIILTI